MLGCLTAETVLQIITSLNFFQIVLYVFKTVKLSCVGQRGVFLSQNLAAVCKSVCY